MSVQDALDLGDERVSERSFIDIGQPLLHRLPSSLTRWRLTDGIRIDRPGGLTVAFAPVLIFVLMPPVILLTLIAIVLGHGVTSVTVASHDSCHVNTS